MGMTAHPDLAYSIKATMEAWGFLWIYQSVSGFQSSSPSTACLSVLQTSYFSFQTAALSAGRILQATVFPQPWV